MYHQETIIDGVLHWRGLPNAPFKPYTAEQITQKLLLSKKRVEILEQEAQELSDKLSNQAVFCS